MTEQSSDPRRVCAECGHVMKFDGVQRLVALGYEYDLHTCDNQACKLYTFTYAGPKRAIEQENN